MPFNFRKSTTLNVQLLAIKLSIVEKYEAGSLSTNKGITFYILARKFSVT